MLQVLRFQGCDMHSHYKGIWPKDVMCIGEQIGVGGQGERGAQIQVNRFNKGSKTFTQIIMQVKNPCAPEKQNFNVTTIESAHDKKLVKYYGTIDNTLWKSRINSHSRIFQIVGRELQWVGGISKWVTLTERLRRAIVHIAPNWILPPPTYILQGVHRPCTYTVSLRIVVLIEVLEFAQKSYCVHCTKLD